MKGATLKEVQQEQRAKLAETIANYIHNNNLSRDETKRYIEIKLLEQ